MPITDIYAMLRMEEGLRLHVYDDANDKPVGPGYTLVGHPTIGVGRALDIDGVSAGEADALLKQDVSDLSIELAELSWYLALDPVRRAAIQGMAFVLGVHGVETFIDMVIAIGHSDWEGAKVAVLASKWAGQEPKRALRVANMLLNGQWPTYVAG